MVLLYYNLCSRRMGRVTVGCEQPSKMLSLHSSAFAELLQSYPACVTISTLELLDSHTSHIPVTLEEKKNVQ